VWMFNKGGLELKDDDVVRAPRQISLPLKALNIFSPSKGTYLEIILWQRMVK
jgi:hypothetical protein